MSVQINQMFNLLKDHCTMVCKSLFIRIKNKFLALTEFESDMLEES